VPDCTRLAICWVIAGSTVARVPLNSPEIILTNSVCAGGSGKEGGLGVVLELAAAFVDSLMLCSSSQGKRSIVTRHAFTPERISGPNISSLLTFKESSCNFSLKLCTIMDVSNILASHAAKL
jgi:hypothetical protein